MDRLSAHKAHCRENIQNPINIRMRAGRDKDSIWLQPVMDGLSETMKRQDGNVLKHSKRCYRLKALRFAKYVREMSLDEANSCSDRSRWH